MQKDNGVSTLITHGYCLEKSRSNKKRKFMGVCKYVGKYGSKHKKANQTFTL